MGNFLEERVILFEGLPGLLEVPSFGGSNRSWDELSLRCPTYTQYLPKLWSRLDVLLATG